MTSVKWLIEKGIFTDTEEILIQELKNHGIEYQTMQYIPFEENISEIARHIYGDNECIVFYGSLNFANKLRRLRWYPGIFGDAKLYDCTSYYPVFGEYLLNRNYIMMPYGELNRRKDFIYNETFEQDTVFFRPNSGLKEFTGQPVSWPNFDEAYKLMGFYDVEPDLLVVVAEYRKVIKEWRFVVENNRIITGSLYRDKSKGDKVLRILCEEGEAFEFASEMAKKYTPDLIWILDICEVEAEGYYVLETGCFNFAGLYGCNLSKIVDRVSNVSLTAWKDIFGENELIDDI